MKKKRRACCDIHRTALGWVWRAPSFLKRWSVGGGRRRRRDLPCCYLQLCQCVSVWCRVCVCVCMCDCSETSFMTLSHTSVHVEIWWYNGEKKRKWVCSRLLPLLQRLWRCRSCGGERGEVCALCVFNMRFRRMGSNTGSLLYQRVVVASISFLLIFSSVSEMMLWGLLMWLISFYKHHLFNVPSPG